MPDLIDSGKGYWLYPGPALTLEALQNRTPEVEAKLAAVRGEWNNVAFGALLAEQAQQSDLTTEATQESRGTADGQQTGYAHGHSHSGPVLAGSGL